MFSRRMGTVAGLFAAFLAADASASLIKNANQANTSNKTVQTTTSGQTQITQKIDPFGTTGFQLDVIFDANLVEFTGIRGINGYAIDSYSVLYFSEGDQGYISNIVGHWVGPSYTEGYYTDPSLSPPTFSSPLCPQNATAPIPPPLMEIDIFEVIYKDLDITQTKYFTVLASDAEDYLAGVDENGNPVVVRGPLDDQGNGIAPSYATVLGIDPGQGGNGGNNVPLPAAALMGMVSGAGLMGKKLFGRNRK